MTTQGQRAQVAGAGDHTGRASRRERLLRYGFWLVLLIGTAAAFYLR